MATRYLNRRDYMPRRSPTPQIPTSSHLICKQSCCLTLSCLFALTAPKHLLGLQGSNIVNGQGFKLYFVETRSMLVTFGISRLKFVPVHY